MAIVRCPKCSHYAGEIPGAEPGTRVECVCGYSWVLQSADPNDPWCCPSCSEKLNKNPIRKARCPFCAEYILVRTDPRSRARIPIRQSDVVIMEEQWKTHHEQKKLENIPTREDRRRWNRRALERILECKDTFPWARILSVSDGNTCPECAALHGKIFRIESVPLPPHVFCQSPSGCRCTITAVSRYVMEKEKKKGNNVAG